jgi:transmembrane 9 superfamily protein 1
LLGFFSSAWLFVFAGVGVQFLTICTGVLLMAMLGMFNVHRHGSINTAAIVLYALTSCK